MTDAELERYYPMCDAIAHQICGRHPRYFLYVEDAAQEAKLAVWRAAKRHDPGRLEFRSYIRRRIKGAVVDVLIRVGVMQRSTAKSFGRAQHLSLDGFLDMDGENLDTMVMADPSDTPEIRATQLFAAKALAGLKPRQAGILYSMYFEGKTGQEVADDFGISEGRVSQIHRDALLTMFHKLSA